VYESKTLTGMDCGYSMIGGGRDGKADRTIVPWAENLMNVGRVRAIEEEEETPVVVLPVPVELHQQAVGFRTGNVIVMDTDPLPRYEFVCCDIHTMAQIHLEQLCDTRLEDSQKSLCT